MNNAFAENIKCKNMKKVWLNENINILDVPCAHMMILFSHSVKLICYSLSEAEVN